MNDLGMSNRVTEYFRDNDLPQGVIEAPNRVEAPMNPQTSPTVEGERGKAEVVNPEREEQIEAWMEQVKAFIRGIDVTRL